MDLNEAQTYVENRGGIKMRLGVNAEKVLKRMEVTAGQCPCVPKATWDDTTICPCLRFKVNQECHCGLFVEIGEY